MVGARCIAPFMDRATVRFSDGTVRKSDGLKIARTLFPSPIGGDHAMPAWHGGRAANGPVCGGEGELNRCFYDR